MSAISPNSKLLDESGGSMIFAVPHTNVDEISQLFSLIQEKSDNKSTLDNITDDNLSQLKSLLKDVGISHTTLEEVFMKVTGKKKSKFLTQAKSPLK